MGSIKSALVYSAFIHTSRMMEEMKLFSVLTVYVIFHFGCCGTVMDIFNNYSTARIPMINNNDVLEVRVRMSIAKLYELNMKDQSITVLANLDMTWNDTFLKWDTSDYDNVLKFQVPTSKVWFPDLAIYNSNENTQDIGQDSHKVEILNSGLLRYWGYKIFTYECKIDITWYPFDTQKCSMDIGMWYNNNSFVQIYDETNNSLAAAVKPNGEFKLRNGGILPYLDQYDDQNFSAMHCLLILERKWFYEVSRAFVPVVAISFLNCLTFGLPAGSGERVTMCISIFLAYIFMLKTLTDLQPRTSDGISILGIYMNFQLVSSILTTTFSILSLHTYHHGSLLEYIKTICRCRNTYVVKDCTKEDVTLKEINANETSPTRESNGQTRQYQRLSNRLDSVLLRLSFIVQIIVLLAVIICVVIMKALTS